MNPQRLLRASTGTKDPAAPDTCYVETLAAAQTIDTIPERALLAFATQIAGRLREWVDIFAASHAALASGSAAAA